LLPSAPLLSWSDARATLQVLSPRLAPRPAPAGLALARPVLARPVLARPVLARTGWRVAAVRPGAPAAQVAGTVARARREQAQGQGQEASRAAVQA